MASVADGFRRSPGDRVRSMSPAERLDLTARLAEWDLDLFCAAQSIPRDEGRAHLAGGRRAGRRPSRVAGGEGR